MALWHRFVSRPLVRNVDAGQLLENFFVAAVGTLLAIRVYLAATGYPQVGGHGLHIAHMLWGGLMMLIAIVLMLAVVGKRVQRIASILGGIGFGTFIDELGKFITSNNNYFFRPTIALIYAIFILMFLAFRAIERRRDFPPDVYLANALDRVREAVTHNMDPDDRTRALALLDKSDPRDPLVAALRSVLRQAPATAERPRASAPARFLAGARRTYVALVGSRRFGRIIVAIFTLHAIAAVINAAVAIFNDRGATVTGPDISFVETGNLLAAALSNGLIVIGVMRLRMSRLVAYRWFKRGILVSIFLVQFFSFYREELIAVVFLLVDLTLLVTLDFVISRERSANTTAPTAGSEPIAERAAAML
jgi:hypothetical protein